MDLRKHLQELTVLVNGLDIVVRKRIWTWETGYMTFST